MKIVRQVKGIWSLAAKECAARIARRRQREADKAVIEEEMELWENDDPTPYCHVCGAGSVTTCDCPKPFYCDNH